MVVISLGFAVTQRWRQNQRTGRKATRHSILLLSDIHVRHAQSPAEIYQKKIISHSVNGHDCFFFLTRSQMTVNVTILKCPCYKISKDLTRQERISGQGCYNEDCQAGPISVLTKHVSSAGNMIIAFSRHCWNRRCIEG